MRAASAALLLAALAGASLVTFHEAVAANRAQDDVRIAAPRQDMTALRRRPRVRIYRSDDRGVYPSYFPGSNAVRDCTATYVQEFRPSGTVIVPLMSCYWRQP